MTKSRFSTTCAALAALTLLAACGGADVSGTYSDKTGLVQLQFKDGKVEFRRLGMTQGIFKYKVKGTTITLSNGGNQTLLLEVDDKGCLTGFPAFGELCKS
ncbi:MAG: hypothetical protein KGJ55_02805 [Gammaproteobacteria bacterium]|nr:hypothetical protein [Gammaproteobacteria bacterium]